MNWKADYNLVLPEQGDELTLTDLVSIENTTGKTFEDARIKLVAGDVNKVQQPNAIEAVRFDGDGRCVCCRSRCRAEEIHEFHMYSLPADHCVIVRPSRLSLYVPGAFSQKRSML